jgi:hypothetical protein
VNKKRVARAKKQAGATNARFANSQGKMPLAFCSSIPFASQKREASCRVIDPPSQNAEDDLIIHPSDAWRVAYAKALRFVGLEAAAHQVIHGYAVTALQPIEDNPERMPGERSSGERLRGLRARRAYERFSANLLLDTGPCAVAIDPRVLRLLREEGVTSEADPVFGHFAQSREAKTGNSFLNYLGLGCIFYDELEGA